MWRSGVIWGDRVCGSRGFCRAEPAGRAGTRRGGSCWGSWHRGMLIDGAVMQVSFLKDLATMRNPVSDFGFVSYLHSRGRLADFINHKILFPTREEFHDYLSWAAARVSQLVRYGTEVARLQPVVPGGTVPMVD